MLNKFRSQYIIPLRAGLFPDLDVEPAEEHEHDVRVILLDSNDEGRVPVAVANVRICLG
jgi:hypothetical protein